VDKQASADLREDRAEIVAAITPVDGRCSVCNMAMRLQFFRELRRGDQVMACESCLRILYYNPPQSVEDVAGSTALQG
jgi:predicted  nucleic acid-binding Zn-ribbon protein